MSNPETLQNCVTATIGVDADGLIVVRLFSGVELEIDPRKTGLIHAALPTSALGFIHETLSRSMFDTLILANLYPRRRPITAAKTATEAMAAQPKP